MNPLPRDFDAETTFASSSVLGLHNASRFALSKDASARTRPACAFEGCTAGWRKLFRRRPRPIFEGAWGCSNTCVRAIVEVAVRRELEGASQTEADSVHSHRMPLGLMLLAQGLVTQDQLRSALAAQRAAGQGRIGHWLIEAAGVSEARVTRGIAMQWQCPVLTTKGFDTARMALVMPPALRELCGVVPVRNAAGRLLYLGFAEQVDSAVAYALERMHGIMVENGIVPLGEFQTAEQQLRGLATVACQESQVANFEEMVKQIADVLTKMQPVESRFVRLRDRYWLRLWLERGAFGSGGMLPHSREDVVDVLFRMSLK